MEMGLINSSEANMKREPDFTDDCYFRVSGFDKEREEFYKWLYNEKKLNNQNKVLEYQENTRTIETIMFFCLYKLSNRSFEYNVLTKQVENENVVTDEKLQQLYRCLLAPIFCNFAILKQSNISMEIRKTTDGRKEGVYDCYNLQYKMLRPLQNHKVTKEEKTRTSGNDNSYVYVTVKQQNIVPDNQEEETSNDSQEDQPEERKESDTIKENSKHETTPDTNKKEESEDSDMDDFEKLLQQKMQGDNFEDEKIRELNEKIKQQKVKMEEDKKNADQKVEAEEREFEENRNRIETEFRKAEKHKQKLNNEEMEKRRREREEYERETENIRQQHIKELHNFVTGFLECIKLKIKWEMKEEEWVDWLKTLRSLVARARNQFLNFEASVQSYGVEDKESRCWVEEDLGKLRQEVRSTHDVLYDAYFFIKELSTQHSDHTFLFILQKQLSKICDILLTVLKGIDETKIEEENCLENLRSLFSLFDSSDIYYTSELRKLDREQDIEKYKDIEDPKKYEPKSDVKKKEMAESSEKTDGKSETQETLPGNLSENEEVTEKGAEESKADQPGVVTESDNCDEEKHPNDEEGNGDEGENNTRRETQMETHAS